VISSGYAREYDDAAGVDQGMSSAFVAGQPMDGTSYPTGAAPAGFPQAAQGCPQDNLVNDMVDVKLVIKAPPDATGFQFDFAFFSSEWPNYVCSNFNDAFVAYLDSSQTHGNISFDSKNNPVSVNNAFFSQCAPTSAPTGCAPQATAGTATCSGGATDLMGTGFYDLNDTSNPYSCGSSETGGGMTGWLTTQAPATPWEQLTIDLLIWDTGDQYYDSSVILDNWQWKPSPVTVSTQPN